MKYLTLFLLLGIAITSCKKESDDTSTPAPKSNELKLEKTFGGSGSDLGQFSLLGNVWPNRFAVSNDHIYIRDDGNKRVQRFTYDLEAVDYLSYEFGLGYGYNTANAAGGLNAKNIRIRNGFLYVFDSFLDAVEILKIDPVIGDTIKVINISVSTSFYGRENFGVDNNGHIYIQLDGKMYKYDEDGNEVLSFNANSIYFEFDEGNNLYISDNESYAETSKSDIKKVTSDGVLITSWKTGYSPDSYMDYFDGALYVYHDAPDNYFAQYSTTGEMLNKWTAPERNTFRPEQFKVIAGKMIVRSITDNEFLVFEMSGQ